MKLRKDVLLKEGVPCRYGASWRIPFTTTLVCYPFPLNWVMALLHTVWLKVRHVPIRKKLLDPHKEVLIVLIDRWVNGQCQWEDVMEAIDLLVKEARRCL